MFYYKNNKVHPILQKMVYQLSKEIELEDVFENMGIQLVKEVDPKRSDETGDGTTTTVLDSRNNQDWDLNQLKVVSNPMEIKKGN